MGCVGFAWMGLVAGFGVAFKTRALLRGCHLRLVRFAFPGGSSKSTAAALPCAAGQAKHSGAKGCFPDAGTTSGLRKNRGCSVGLFPCSKYTANMFLLQRKPIQSIKRATPLEEWRWQPPSEGTLLSLSLSLWRVVGLKPKGSQRHTIHFVVFSFSF